VSGATAGAPPARLVVAGRWLAITALLNLIWELAQLPLYTIWTEAPHRVVFLAALHCTAGDVAIAAVALLAALLLLGWTWPAANFLRVAIATVVFAVNLHDLQRMAERQHSQCLALLLDNADDTPTRYRRSTTAAVGRRPISGLRCRKTTASSLMDLNLHQKV
jgi:hypothetical protein